MSRVEGYQNQRYLFSRDGRLYSLSSETLYYLFFAYDQCIDPCDVSTPLADLNGLITLAERHQDRPLLSLLYRQTKISVRPISSLSVSVRQLWEIVLEIGLYLIGWNGWGEPFPTSCRPWSDSVATELIIDKLLRRLRDHPDYSNLREEKIVVYEEELPRFTDSTISQLLTQLHLDNSCELGRQLIGTAYYHLTRAYPASYPMLHHLL